MSTSSKTEKAVLWAGVGLAAVAVGRAWARYARTIDLQNKVVLVTGGSRGLGLELARQLASAAPRGEGARVAICARDADELQRAKLQLLGQGADVETFVCDVGHQEQCQQLVADVEARLGPIDVLINNAANMQIGPAEFMAMEDYEASLRVQFWGPLYLSYAVIPEMRRRGGGRIVNICSFGGKIGLPHMTPYSAGKHALAGLSKSLRAEFAKDKIHVCTIYPTLLRTGSLYNVVFKGARQTEFAMGSIASSTSLLSISAPRAAREIIECCKRGDAEAVLTRRMQAATAFGVVFPGLTTDLLGLATRFLPMADSSGAPAEGRLGKESFSALAPSLLTGPNDEAARQFNETLAKP